MNKYYKNVNKLFWVNLFNNCFWLSSVVTFFYLQRNLSYAEILSLGAIMGLTIILFEIPTGVIADKYGRKKSLIFSSIFFMLSMFCYLIANNIFLFALAFIFLGIGITFASGATEALIYDSLKISKKESEMRKSMGHFFSAEVLAGVITPPLASIIAKDLIPWQFNLLIYLTLASYLAAFIITLTLKDIPLKKYEIKSFAISFKDLKLLKENKKLRRLALNRVFIAVAMSSFVLLWQPQFQTSHVPVAWFGVFLAIGSLGIFFVNRKIEWLSKLTTSKTLLIISGLAPAIGFIILGLVFNPIIAVITYLLIRIIVSVREPILSQHINDSICSEKRATILSLISMVVALITLILRPIIGALTDVSLTIGFLTLGILCVISLTVFPITKKYLKDEYE